MDLISIIVPIYNVELYLRQCIDSIINQTYRNLEIILVDDGSPDNCPQICDEYAQKDPRIKVIHKKNGGLGAARNSGLEIATGNFIGFVDSDDFIAPEMFESLHNAFSDDIGVVSCDIQCYKYGKYSLFHTSISLLGLDKIIVPQSDLLKSLLITHSIENMVWNKLYRADLIKNIKFVHRNYEDACFMYEVFKNLINFNLNYFRISKSCYYYRYLENSISNSTNNPLMFDKILNMNDILSDLHKNKLDVYSEYKLKLQNIILSMYYKIFDNNIIYSKYAKSIITIIRPMPTSLFIRNYSICGKVKVFFFVQILKWMPILHKYLIKEKIHQI